MGWALLHQLTIKLYFTDLTTNQSDINNLSNETALSGYSVVCLAAKAKYMRKRFILACSSRGDTVCLGKEGMVVVVVLG